MPLHYIIECNSDDCSIIPTGDDKCDYKVDPIGLTKGNCDLLIAVWREMSKSESGEFSCVYGYDDSDSTGYSDDNSSAWIWFVLFAIAGVAVIVVIVAVVGFIIYKRRAEREMMTNWQSS